MTQTTHSASDGPAAGQLAAGQPAATHADPPPLARARVVGKVLDESVAVPGTGFRIGLDPILGILPVAGDSVAAIASLYIVFAGLRLGLPARALAKMLGYVAVDFFVGSIPFFGVLVDALLKVNERNVATIERHVHGG